MSVVRSLLLGCVAVPVILFGRVVRADNAECMACHADPDLESETGRKVSVAGQALAAGAHGRLGCRQCHSQPGDYEDTPHVARYRPVDCGGCHEEATASFASSFHGQAHGRGEPGSPGCLSCHRAGRDAHNIEPLEARTAEKACRRCHEKESGSYDASVHEAAAAEGKPSPGCVGCHQTHTAALPPSVGAINKLCDGCHAGAMGQVRAGGHGDIDIPAGQVSCVSCHDAHGAHKPHLDGGILKACNGCHEEERQAFVGSIHEPIWSDGGMSCLSCHRTHQVDDAAELEGFGCGACHEEVEREYRTSAHRLARLHGDRIAATCSDCHGGHNVLPISDPTNPMSPREVPNTCGKCHSGQAVITADYVRLPISLPRYVNSVHGVGWKNGIDTAVCTDCHGTHEILTAASATSKIHKGNLAVTCGRCHEEEAADYARSVHGRAVAHGIEDSPSCTDCHEEHLILPHTDPRSPVHPERLASETCARCHEDQEMAARYGLPPEVVESYRDSYHGWATQRHTQAVAVCTDCHETHAIGSALDPSSSIHTTNVVATCGKCHPNASQKFAASYAHVLARGRRMPHDWARFIYVWLLVVLLGGMFLHNLVIARYDLGRHYRHQRQEPAVPRLTRAERIQHLLLLGTFSILAVSGFALRFPDSWWVEALTTIGFSEETRRLVHRATAVVMVAASVYHVAYLLLSERGRFMARALLPRLSDARDAFANIRYHLRPHGEKPTFGFFDYTQKAEYWALVWGTILMGLTGLVLWFPEIAVRFLPVWAVRVCEVVHFYEAILAVSAIVIWHLFFVVFRPSVFPMSWVWLTGRMPEREWRENHGRAAVPESDRDS